MTNVNNLKLTDPLTLLARANPVPACDVEVLALRPDYERTYALIAARRSEPPPAPRRHRRLAVVFAALLALAVPAYAFSGEIGSLFGFSNEGTSVDSGHIDLNSATALAVTGVAPGTLKLVASRAGIGIYAARSGSGNLCYFVGPPNGPDERGLGGGCLNRLASAEFPSPKEPVIDMSAFAYRAGAAGERITRLAGVAADGVATVEALGSDCRRLASVPVVDNVYAAADVPDAPAAAIQALDGNGNVLYLEKLRLWNKSACASGIGG